MRLCCIGRRATQPPCRNRMLRSKFKSIGVYWARMSERKFRPISIESAARTEFQRGGITKLAMEDHPHFYIRRSGSIGPPCQSERRAKPYLASPTTMAIRSATTPGSWQGWRGTMVQRQAIFKRRQMLCPHPYSPTSCAYQNIFFPTLQACNWNQIQ